MLDKNNYIAVTVSENGKYYAYALKVHQSENICWKLDIKGIEHANICNTKKECSELVNFWNECYKNNGTYMFDFPRF